MACIITEKGGCNYKNRDATQDTRGVKSIVRERRWIIVTTSGSSVGCALGIPS